MTTPLSGAAESGAPTPDESPIWEPSAGPGTGATLEPSDQQPGTDPGPMLAPVSDAQVGPYGATPRKRRSRSVPVLLWFAAVIAVAGLCFTVGRVSAPGQTTISSGQNGLVNGLPGANASGLPGLGGNAADGLGGAGFGGSVTGTVVSVSDSSMTVQLADGQTVEVALGSSTTYHNQTSASSSDIAAGDTVQVQVSGGNGAGPNASASASASSGTRTATDVTVTGP